MALWLGPSIRASSAVQFLIFLVIMLLWGMALYRARRYRLSRTLWRGIRSALVGSSMSYSLLYFGALLLRTITLGWSTPAMNLNLQERMIGDMRFGNMPFRFRGGAGPLYGRYAICWFLAIVVFVIVAWSHRGGVLRRSSAPLSPSCSRSSTPTMPTQPRRPEDQGKIIGLIVYAASAILMRHGSSSRWYGRSMWPAR